MALRALVAITAITAAAATAGDARPPWFLPSRADTLILSGGASPEAGSAESMPALAKFECQGNACDRQSGKEGALGESVGGGGANLAGAARARACGARDAPARCW